MNPILNHIGEDGKEAIRRFNRGEPLNVSQHIGEWLTFGYGELSDNGDWEFPFIGDPKELCLVPACKLGVVPRNIKRN